MNPTDKLDTAERTAETDGGEELAEDNIYQITPEGLVAILQQQVSEVAALKPDMNLSELSQFMQSNEERLVGEAEDLLEAMDGEE
jgi:DNA-binding PadR family transcriptional regulator